MTIIHVWLQVGMSQMALAIFRMCAAAARNLEAANSFGSTALIILLIVGGFILSKSEFKNEVQAQIAAVVYLFTAL